MTAKGRPLVPRPQLVGAGDRGAAGASLQRPEAWTRHQAKRLLQLNAARTCCPRFAALGARDQPSGPGKLSDHRLVLAVMYQALDVVTPATLTALLRSPDHHVRAAATRVVYHWHGGGWTTRSSC